MGDINYGGKKGGISYGKESMKKIPYPAGKPNLERDTEIELTELQKDFREKAKKEAEKKAENTDTEHFMCISFQNQEQRNEFARLLGVSNQDNQYINGVKLIKALELRIAVMEKESPGKFKVNKEIANLALDISFYH